MSYAHIFPGQGSQFPGMGKEIYESSSKARDMMERANLALGFRITDIMFGDDAQALQATRVTQPAILLHSVVLSECASPAEPAMVGGHSLGEFSALVSAGVLEFEDALRLVSVRAEAMQRCCEKVPGAMAAILGLDDKTVSDICDQTPGTVIPANFNCPGQVVISGEIQAVQAACEKLKEAGARRAAPLGVGGAFHSPLMEPARKELAAAIEDTPFRSARCPVYQNATGTPETHPDRIRENLLAQLTSPVLWTLSIERMLEDGARNFIEIGPGKVLQGLVKRIAGDRAVEITLEGIQ
ncbi:MAG: ACP S-malonyltransferase [Bacteroidales bacterium]|nr:ACP S-malonyltransferase [Bacteroidales bacterium]